MNEDDTNEGAADGAQAQMDFLKFLAESGAGVEYVGDPRNDGVTNEEIILWHAAGIRTRNGVVVRDITPNDADVEKCAQAFMEALDKQLDRIGRKTKSGGVVTSEQQHKAGIASGLKKAADVVAEVMVMHLKQQTGSDGMPLRKVTDDYARSREREWNVSGDVVFHASGQLAQTLDTGYLTGGRYRLFYDPKKVDSMVRSAGR